MPQEIKVPQDLPVLQEREDLLVSLDLQVEQVGLALQDLLVKQELQVSLALQEIKV